MKSPFITQSQNLPKTILVIDQFGAIGSRLIKIIQAQDESAHIVFVTARRNEQGEKITVIPFQKHTAFIPNLAYAHVFIVYTGQEWMVDMISGVLDKSAMDGGRVVLLSHFRRLSDPLFSRLSTHPDISLVVCGELFGSEEYEGEGIVNTLLKNAKSHVRMVVPGDGLEKVYLTHVQDVTAGMLKGAMSTKKQTIILVYPQHPPTVLRVAHHIQKIDPAVRLDFGPPVQSAEPPKIVGEYLFEKYPLKERIKEAYEEMDEQKDILHIPWTPYAVQKTALFTPVSAVLFMLMVLLLPVIVSGVGVVTGGFFLKHTIEEVGKGNLSSARNNILRAEKILSIALITADITKSELSYIGKEHVAQSLASFILAEREAAGAGVYALDAAIRYNTIVEGSSKKPEADMIMAINDAKNAVATYQRLRAENGFEQLQKTASFMPSGSSVQRLFKTLDFLTATSGTLLDVSPQLLGFEKKMSYLVLFQNNMELRPGGGFIGSYGVATFSNGKLTEFPIHDVYDADGQLKGHIEPPFALRRHMPSVHLYLRDSNFSPDFSKSASSAAFLLSQETGEQVDGVIAVDVSFLQKILRAIGPIYVSDYKETVTAQNVFVLTESHAEKNSFAGSSQKKDFLRSLFTALQLRLSEKKVSYTLLLEAMENAIVEKHALVAFADSGIQNIASVNHLSSSLWDDRIEDSVTVNDFLGLSEANLGVNKANYFVQRRINQQVSVDDEGVVRSTVEVQYANASKEWPGGDYKNYLRFVLPLHSTLTGITIDGQDQIVAPAVTDPQIYEGKNFKAPKGLEVETVEEGDKTIYGFLVNVPQGGGVKTVTLSYAHPHKVSFEQPVFTYDQLVFKQPGTDGSPYEMTFFYPEGFKPAKAPAEARDNGQSITISSDTLTDRGFHLEFARK